MAIVFDDEPKKSSKKIVFDDEVQQSSPVGMLDALTASANQYTQSPAFRNSPQALLAKLPEYASMATKKLGDKTTEMLASEGFRSPLSFSNESIPVSPGVAQGIGTAIEYSPEALQLLQPIPKPKVIESAIGPMRRALGFQKSLLKTPFARGQAQKAARTALEEGVTSATGNPMVMLEKATALKNKSGAQIEKVLESVPADFSRVRNSLKQLKGELTQGTKGGLYAKTESVIKDTQTTLKQLEAKAAKGQQLSLKAINAVKKKVADSINFLSDNAAQADSKAVQNRIANNIRTLVKDAVAVDGYSKFLENQKLYGASKKMLQGLNNEIAGQMGNRATSLLSLIPAAGQIGARNLPGAAATLGLGEALFRRGAGITANAIQQGGQALPQALMGAATLAGSRIPRKRKGR